MKHQVISGLTALLLVSTIGTLEGHAQNLESQQPSDTALATVSSEPNTELNANPSSETVNSSPMTGELELEALAPDSSSNLPANPPADLSADLTFNPLLEPQSSQAPSGSSSLNPSSLNPSSLNPSSLDPSSIILINAHRFENHPAATLYVHDIPVLTFLSKSQEAIVASETAKATGDVVNPVEMATTMGQRLDDLYDAGIDATTLSVRWDAPRNQYVVMLGAQELIALSDTVILPDTTENAAEDALQITNRLRRLLGGADPVTEIEGRPQPVVPATQVAIVRSTLRGTASWYGPGFHGRRSANGEVFNQNAMTAAHRTLPFGTRVRVTNLNNGRQVVVRINDRGPYSGGRIIDLSAGAARSIGLISAGTGPVQLEVLER